MPEKTFLPQPASKAVFNTDVLFRKANAVVTFVDGSIYSVGYFSRLDDEKAWELGTEGFRGDGDFAAIPDQDVEVSDQGWVEVKDDCDRTWRLQFLFTQVLTPERLARLVR